MLEMRWLGHLPNESLDGGVELVNELYWNLSMNTDGKTWVVRGGEVVILRTDNHEVADAFLYGLGLAYSVIPEPCWDRLKTDVGSETGLDRDDEPT